LSGYKNLERQDINIKDNIFSLLSENDKIEREIKGLSRGRIPLEYLGNSKSIEISKEFLYPGRILFLKKF